MIEIRSASSVLPEVVRFGHYGIGSVAVGSICVGDVSNGASTYSSEVQFGFLTQIRPVSTPHYGNLRDKDVIHLNAKGTITMEGGAASGSPPDDPEDLGTVYTLEGSPTLVSIMTPWGEDAVFTGTIHIPRTWNSYYSRWIKEQFVPMRNVVRFGSNRGIAYLEIDPWPSVLEDLNVTIAHNHPEEKLYFLSRLETGSGTEIRVTSAFSAIHDNCSNPTVTVGNYTKSWSDWLTCDPDGSYTLPTTVFPWLSVGEYGNSSSVDTSELEAYLLSDSFRNRISTILASAGEPISPTHPVWHQLVTDVLEQQRFVTSNLIVSLFEIGDWSSLVEKAKNWKMFSSSLPDAPPDLSVFPTRSRRHRAVRKGKALMKELGSTELQRRYGILPTISDFQAVKNGWQKFLRNASVSRYHSRRTVDWELSFLGSPILSDFVLTAEVIPLPMDIWGTALQVIRNIRTTGFYPGWTAAWDAIPYSFLMDGIVNVSSITESLDMQMDKVLYPVSYYIESEKRTWTPDLALLLPDFQVEGVVEFSRYDRRVSGGLELPATTITLDDAHASLELLQGAMMIGLTRSL